MYHVAFNSQLAGVTSGEGFAHSSGCQNSLWKALSCTDVGHPRTCPGWLRRCPWQRRESSAPLLAAVCLHGGGEHGKSKHPHFKYALEPGLLCPPRAQLRVEAGERCRSALGGSQGPGGETSLRGKKWALLLLLLPLTFHQGQVKNCGQLSRAAWGSPAGSVPLLSP